MIALTFIKDAGLQASIDDSGGLKLKGLSRLAPERKNQIIEFARTHKQAILAALSHPGGPSRCESCPAAGYWDYAQYSGHGLLCFYSAFFQGRSGKPKPCSEMRANCPRKDERQ